MPVHDWSCVDTNTFHHFHQTPLEATYQQAWATCPADLRELVETGRLPGEDE